MLFAGTEKGIYVSWNGGKQWEPFQLNLPVTPVLDLMIHQGDLAVATSGRSIWILDDLNVLRQKSTASSVKLYQPEEAVYGFWGSPLNSSNTQSFDGTDPFEGVNPANGVVIYYELPALEDSVEIIMKITDSKGAEIQSFSSEKDQDYIGYPGGPPPAQTISKAKGLNRFVWDMRYPIMPGIPEAYIEGSYRGHRVNPGTYSITLSVNGQEYTQPIKVVNNPTIEVSDDRFEAYDKIMTEMEATLTAMHDKVNQLNMINQQLKKVKAKLSDPTLIKNCEALMKALSTWDEKMVQRKSKAYDDVENFENKFTAHYLYLINSTESTLPRVNASAYERKTELDALWKEYETEANQWLEKDLPAFNQALWEAGIGAIQLK